MPLKLWCCWCCCCCCCADRLYGHAGAERRQPKLTSKFSIKNPQDLHSVKDECQLSVEAFIGVVVTLGCVFFGCDWMTNDVSENENPVRNATKSKMVDVTNRIHRSQVISAARSSLLRAQNWIDNKSIFQNNTIHSATDTRLPHIPSNTNWRRHTDMCSTDRKGVSTERLR